MVPYLSRIEGPPPKKKADYRLFWKLKTGQPRNLLRNNGQSAAPDPEVRISRRENVLPPKLEKLIRNRPSRLAKITPSLTVSNRRSLESLAK